ncbi:MAG: aminotransferase class V-fold PLP-dependent enzyme [Alphaproteobacteria bacterium]|nr:aminotransferase class V-fold PLP-dependent enzyme [Alphaproteobacteria bacterium]
MIDVERVRAETPGCRNVIHFNNAGAALQPRPVLDAVLGHLTLEGEIGGYEAADCAAARLDAVYASIARLLNAAPDEIALTENATRAWDMAFYAVPLGPGDRVLTASAEYASNYIAFLQAAKHRGAEIVVVPSDADGALSLDALAAMIDARVKLIAVTHVPTNGGLVNPAAAIGRIARRHGVPFLLDACQSVGQMPIDVTAIGCDMLSATGRKFLRGPRGTGFLWVRRALIEELEPPFLDLHAARWTGPESYEIRADARRFENWESFVAGRLGLGIAAEYALALGLDAIAARVEMLAETLRRSLRDIPGVAVHDLGTRRCGIVTFTMERVPAETIQAALAAARINTVTSSLFSTRHDMTRRGLDMLLRASVHYYNTEEEIGRLCEIVRRLSPAAA